MKDDMLDRAREVRRHAYAPYSKFYVGACLRAEDDSLFVGCNIENASYSLALCAEASALASLISAGKRKVKEVAIVGSADFCPPCGSCLQRLIEFADADTPVHIGSPDGKIEKSFTLKQFMPLPFTSSTLEKP